ncbi:helix-turn-helix domain-containing protein [Brevibacillus ruminantium]|uniref:Helix-turn-helix domain-containing protein n=1 Tax=Brevibacillus ruminantium TaxID=2950604 RepID=A0ABY4WBB5_9BACL|nr:helix-turn-helix domain-containing protein [Brevibacillus ruminantium]USG64475.1 helix-turn-helix domain-containing protein [Brevibacillus ruminantium]
MALLYYDREEKLRRDSGCGSHAAFIAPAKWPRTKEGKNGMDPIKRLLSAKMEHCAITLYQVAAQSADDLHDHEEFYQISIPLGGSPHMQCNREVRRVAGGERLVLSPGYQHRHFAGDETALMMLVFVQESFLRKVMSDRLEKEAGSIEFAPWGNGATDRFRLLAEKSVMQTMKNPLNVLERQELEWELASLLLSLQEGTHAIPARGDLAAVDHPAIRRAIELIHDESSADLTLDRLVEVSGISKYHLIRLFREQTGQTPGRFLAEQRIKKARSLLEGTSLDITFIAYESGFGSLRTFERAFKNAFGASPSEYRRQRGKR